MTILSERQLTALSRRSRVLKALPVTALVLDAGLLTVVGLLAVIGRRELAVFETGASVEEQLGVAGPLMLLGWLASLFLLGGYRRDAFGAGADEYKTVFNASLMAAGLTGVGCYLAKFSLSRGFFVLAFALGVPALLLGRWALRRLLHSARRHGALRQRVLIAGTRAHVDEIAGILRRETWLGYEVVGALTPEYDLTEETGTGVPVLGNADDATSVAKAARADMIVVAGGALGSATRVRELVWELEGADVSLVVAPNLTEVSSDRVTMRQVGGLPLMYVQPPTWSDASRWGKRAFDLAGSLALILAFLPVLTVSALAVWLHDRGPILFRQTRTGRHGEEFACLKFRSMVIDAEARLAALHEQEGYSEGLFKMKDDPRITGPGRLLRRFSLDELPQLFNVLRGDMSLVGPRPPLPHEVATYTPDTARRLHVRPGMTGLWQVSGRSDLSWSEAIRLDLYYVDNWSMLQDLSILARTVSAVFSSRGAY